MHAFFYLIDRLKQPHISYNDHINGINIIQTNEKYITITDIHNIIIAANAANTMIDIGSITKNLDQLLDQTLSHRNLNNF
jgi:hypothetical protein